MPPSKRRASTSPPRKRKPSASSSEISAANAYDIESPPHAKTASAPATAPPATGLRQDLGPICLLLLLYTLQGVPMGLNMTMGALMNSKISMKEQGNFSFASWPFALKLLWAPLVDSVYNSRFGRRKTWIVPVQAMIGVAMVLAGPSMDALMGSDGGPVEVGKLTAYFFFLYFLAATQDIAVDGLALTILSPCNKELGATCNTIGQTLGALLASAGFLLLRDLGVLDLGGFMVGCGWVFLASTVWVARVKNDEHTPLCGSALDSLTAAYGEMLQVLRLPAVRSLAIVLLSCRAALGVFGSATRLRIQAAGIPMNFLLAMGTVVMALGMPVQLYVTDRYLTNKQGQEEAKPLSVFGAVYPGRLVTGLVSCVLVHLVTATDTEGGVPYWLYAVVAAASFCFVAVQESAFVSLMAFFNRVSDPAIGGTYMTMLNTISNLGSAWPATFALYLVGQTTITRCVPLECVDIFPGAAKVRNILTGRPEGDCGCVETTIVDGYLITCGVSLVMGIAWYIFMSKRVAGLQALPLSAWRIPKQ